MADQSTLYESFDRHLNKLGVEIPSVGEIDPDTIGSGSIVGSVSQSSNTNESAVFVSGSAGWQLGSDGIIRAVGVILSGSITATSGAIGGFSITTTSISSTGLLLTSGAAASLAFGTTPPTGVSVGTGIYLDKTGLFGLSSNTQNFKLDATNGNITSIAGTIGGWVIGSDMLKSSSTGARIELNQSALRVSIFDATNEKVVMGYLNGLPKHDGSGNWGVSNYGFWARQGDMLSIDGDSEYVSGDWLIQNDASYLVKDASDDTIIRLGTDTGEKGLFIYNTTGTQLAKLISDEIYIGTTTSYLQYTTISGLSLYSNITNGITLDYGSNVLLKEGGCIKFTSVAFPTACTATLVVTNTGNVDNGTHSYAVTFVTTTGETELGTASNEVTVDATHKQVDLTNIATSSSSAVSSRKIYRTKAGGADYYLLTTIGNNSATTYTDNVSDANLTGSYATFRDNDTFGKIIIDNIESLSLGKRNTLVGQGDGTNITAGYSNVAVGNAALYSITSGFENTAIGHAALYDNDVGYQNTAIGENALSFITTGSLNVAIGFHAGTYYTNGGQNKTSTGSIYLGCATRANADGDSGEIVIGYDVTGNGSNTLVIGNLLSGVFSNTATNRKLTINGLLNLAVSKTPANSGATGTAGDICWDASYIYVCTSTDTWKRAAISTW